MRKQTWELDDRIEKCFLKVTPLNVTKLDLFPFFILE